MSKSEARLVAPEGPDGFQGCNASCPCKGRGLAERGLHTDQSATSRVGMACLAMSTRAPAMSESERSLLGACSEGGPEGSGGPSAIGPTAGCAFACGPPGSTGLT